MTFISEPDLDRVNMNQHSKHLGQRLLSSKVTVHIHTYTYNMDKLLCWTRTGSVWIFQIRFDSVRSSISSTRFRFFRFRYLHTTTMQEYPNV